MQQPAKLNFPPSFVPIGPCPKLLIVDGPVSSLVDTHNGLTLVQYARWKGHDGICYLIPHVHAGCLLRGERSR